MTAVCFDNRNSPFAVGLYVLNIIRNAVRNFICALRLPREAEISANFRICLLTISVFAV